VGPGQRCVPGQAPRWSEGLHQLALIRLHPPRADKLHRSGTVVLARVEGGRLTLIEAPRSPVAAADVQGRNRSHVEDARVWHQRRGARVEGQV